MNAKQREAVEVLRKRFENMIQHANSFKENLKLEIKRFEVTEQDEELIQLIGYDVPSVYVVTGYVDDENNALIFERKMWSIAIGKNGGYSAHQKDKYGKSLKTRIHGLDNCIKEGSFKI